MHTYLNALKKYDNFNVATYTTMQDEKNFNVALSKAMLIKSRNCFFSEDDKVSRYHNKNFWFIGIEWTLVISCLPN